MLINTLQKTLLESTVFLLLSQYTHSIRWWLGWTAMSSDPCSQVTLHAVPVIWLRLMKDDPFLMLSPFCHQPLDSILYVWLFTILSSFTTGASLSANLRLTPFSISFTRASSCFLLSWFGASGIFLVLLLTNRNSPSLNSFRLLRKPIPLRLIFFLLLNYSTYKSFTPTSLTPLKV